MGPAPGPRGHGLVNPSASRTGEGWVVGCLCGWMADDVPSEPVALASYDAHLASVRLMPSPIPPKQRPAPPVAPDALAAGTTVQGTLIATNPGWRLDRPDGMALKVAVTDVRPARVAGRAMRWQLVGKKSGVWEIRPNPST